MHGWQKRAIDAKRFDQNLRDPDCFDDSRRRSVDIRLRLCYNAQKQYPPMGDIVFGNRSLDFALKK